jgi:hypothetical protein
MNLQSFLANRKQALASPTRHQFVPGVGYIAHAGPPPLPVGANGSKNCDPLEGTAASMHLLQPPGGHPKIAMKWLPAAKAWASPKPGKGNRLAWPAAYLQKAGWAYVGPTKE